MSKKKEGAESLTKMIQLQLCERTTIITKVTVKYNKTLKTNHSVELGVSTCKN